MTSIQQRAITIYSPLTLAIRQSEVINQDRYSGYHLIGARKSMDSLFAENSIVNGESACKSLLAGVRPEWYCDGGVVLPSRNIVNVLNDGARHARSQLIGALQKSAAA